MMELVGLDKQSIHFINEVENNVRSDKVYSEPSDDPNDTTEKSKNNEVEPEAATKPQHLFGFTYKPGQNVPEELSYKEEFVTKLSSKVDFETFELGEDGYPPIFDIVIQSCEKEKRSKSAAEFVPKIPNFLFTYKPNEWSENLNYTDKSVNKLSPNIELEEIVLKDQAVIEDILNFQFGMSKNEPQNKSTTKFEENGTVEITEEVANDFGTCPGCEVWVDTLLN